MTCVRDETAWQRKGFLQRCDCPARCEEADQSGAQDADAPRDEQPVTQQWVIIVTAGGVGRVAQMQRRPTTKVSTATTATQVAAICHAIRRPAAR